MVFERTCSFWVPDLMIFCIIELHLSLLLRCFGETVAEAKQTRHMSTYLDEMVCFCHPVQQKYARQIVG